MNVQLAVVRQVIADDQRHLHAECPERIMHASRREMSARQACCTSKPRPHKSVEISTRLVPERNLEAFRALDVPQLLFLKTVVDAEAATAA